MPTCNIISRTLTLSFLLTVTLLQSVADIRACSIKADEQIIFFPTTGRFNNEQKAWKVIIHGWIFEPETDSPTVKSLSNTFGRLINLSEDEIESKIFKERSRLFFVDNERGKKITVRIRNKIYQLKPSRPNGHFEYEVTVPLEPSTKQDGQNTSESIFFETVCDAGHKTYTGTARLINGPGISVISDIDDTIKISEVLDRKALIQNTFVKEFRDVPGMANLYRELERSGAVFHYVSASPWQLYPPLSKFMADR